MRRVLHRNNYISRKNRKPAGLAISAAAALLLFLIPAGTASAETVFDWGGFVHSSSDASYVEQFGLEQEARAGLWVDTSFSELLSLDVQGSYLYTLDRPVFGDLDRFLLSGRFTQSGDGGGWLLGYRAGRFTLSEFSGLVFDHRIDGLDLRAELPWLSLKAGAGYTGLNFTPSNRILVTRSDLTVQADTPSHGYALASPKLVERAELTFPQLLLRQDVTVSLAAQQDLQPAEKLDISGVRLHTEYAGLGISGSTLPELFHDLYGYFNYSHGSYQTLAYMAGGELSYYAEDLAFSRVTLGGLYSSGDSAQDYYHGGYSGSGYSRHFIPLSHAEQFGIVFSPSPGNLAVGELSYSVKPFAGTRSAGLNELQLKLRAMSFLRSTTGAISADGVNSASGEHYLGSEADLRISYRPFSDLGITLTGGAFFPNNYSSSSAMDPSGPPVEYAGRFELSFRF
jgi:hypothetical protein